MKVHQETITVTTRGRGLVDIRTRVAAVVEHAAVTTGLCSLFLAHTSAGLVVQENADPAVRRDLEKWIARVAPESSDWEHDDEGPDDMPAHLRAVLTRSAETLPVAAGRLALGTWQTLYLWEHRARGHERHIVVTVMGA